MDIVETTDHILQCHTREPVYSKFYTQFTELMWEKELPNDILELFDAGINIALFMPLQFSFDEGYIDAADIMTDEQVTTILINDKIQLDRREAFVQQMRMGWTRIFMGFFTTGWGTSTEGLDHKWMSSCTHLFLKWGHACWTHRNSHLYGPPKQ